MTEVNPPSIQALHNSNESPWSRCKAIGRLISSRAASTSFTKYPCFTYFLAPADTVELLVNFLT